MKVIYKYKLRITDCQTIDLPINSHFLSVQVQDDEICLWVLLDPNSTMREIIEIHIFGTGNPIKFSNSLKFIDTVQLNGFVWHVFFDDVI